MILFSMVSSQQELYWIIEQRVQKTWVRGLPNVFTDTYLKFIAFFFLMIVAHEAGVGNMYLKPIYFFG